MGLFRGSDIKFTCLILKIILIYRYYNNCIRYVFILYIIYIYIAYNIEVYGSSLLGLFRGSDIKFTYLILKIILIYRYYNNCIRYVFILYIIYIYVVRALLSMRRLVMFTQMIHKCVYIIQLYFN